MPKYRKHTDYTRWWTWGREYNLDPEDSGYGTVVDYVSYPIKRMKLDHIESVVAMITVKRPKRDELWVRKTSKYTDLNMWLAVFTQELARRGAWDIIHKYDLDEFKAYATQVRSGAANAQ